MPADDYVLHDTVSGNYVSAYTDVAHFSPTGNECDLAHLIIAPVRTQAQCNTIHSDLSTVYPSSRFAVGVRPKPKLNMLQRFFKWVGF